MLIRTSMFVALSAIAACKGGKDGGEKPLEPAVFGKVVAPPGDLGKLRAGMPAAEARTAAATLVPKQGETYDLFPSGIKDVRFGVGMSKDGSAIQRLRVELPADGKAVVAQAWGPGQDVECTGRPCTYWFAPETGTRAVLEESVSGGAGLEFTAYTPVAKLLGATPGALGFETTPIVGVTVDELRKAYAQLLVEQPADPAKNKRGSLYLRLPPTEFGRYETRVHPYPKGDRIKRVTFTIDYPNPKAKAAILATVEAAWGKGISTKNRIGKDETVWLNAAGKRRAKLDATFDGQLQFELVPMLPLTALLGEGPDKFGFETTPLLGATWADIQKAYPDAIESETDEQAKAKRKQLENFMGEDKDRLAVLGEAKGSTTFMLPVTEWGNQFTMVQFRFDDSGAVTSYAFDIGYGQQGEAKAEIRGALDAKFPGAKEYQKYGRTKITLRAKAPKIEAEDNTIGKAWSIRVER